MVEKTTWDNRGALSWQYNYEMAFDEERFTANVFLSEMSSTLSVDDGGSNAVYEKLQTLFEKDNEYSREPASVPKENNIKTNFSCLLFGIVLLSPFSYGIYNLFFQ